MSWSEVAPGLFMGGRWPAPSASDFDAVLTLGYREKAVDGIPLADQLEWVIADAPRPPPAKGLATAVAFVVDGCKNGKRVLVRCEMGLNRSGLVVGLALVAAGWTPDEAIAAIRAARGSFALSNQTYRRLIAGDTVVATTAGFIDDTRRHLREDAPARWGRYGAAGILFRRPSDGRYLLLHRSATVIDPARWALPGGALHAAESPWQGALREAREEIGPLPTSLEPSSVHEHQDPAGWTYTTFIVDAEPTVVLNHEHTAHKWVTADQGWRMWLQLDLALGWRDLTGAGPCPPTFATREAPLIGWRLFSAAPDVAAAFADLARGEPPDLTPCRMQSPWSASDWPPGAHDVSAVCDHTPAWDDCLCGLYTFGCADHALHAVSVFRHDATRALMTGRLIKRFGFFLAAVAQWGEIRPDPIWPGATRSEHMAIVGDTVHAVRGTIGSGPAARVAATYGLRLLWVAENTDPGILEWWLDHVSDAPGRLVACASEAASPDSTVAARLREQTAPPAPTGQTSACAATPDIGGQST